MPRSLDQIIAYADEHADTFDGDDTRPGGEDRVTAAMLGRAAYRRASAERELAETIRAAHEQGMSWREIGEAIGTSGEATRQRYGRRK